MGRSSWSRRGGAVVAAALAIAAVSRGARAAEGDETARDPARRLAPANPVCHLERNDGQAPDGWDFLARARRYHAFLRAGELVLSCDGRPLRIVVDGFAPSRPDVAAFETAAYANYFVGNVPAEWRTRIPVVNGATYHDAADARSWTVAARGGALEMTWRLDGRDEPSFVLDGGRARVASDGSLRVAMPKGEARLSAPVAWQEAADGARRAVTAEFRLVGDGRVVVALGVRNPALPTWVDPVVDYSTYLGGNSEDMGSYVAIDSTGAPYVAGQSKSTTFPATTGAYATSHASDSSNWDMTLTKLDASAATLTWSTYLGGNSSDSLENVGIGSSDEPILIGGSSSSNFPTTPGVLSNSNTLGNTKAAVARLKSTGDALVWSTYKDGSINHGVVAPDDSVVVSDASSITRIGAAGNATWWTIRVVPGGFSNTQLYGCAASAASDGTVRSWAFGTSADSNWTLSSGSYQSQSNGGGDAFLFQYDGGGALVWSSFVGGTSQEIGSALAVDASRRPVLVGRTTSSNFPTTAGAAQSQKGTGDDVFVARFAEDGKSLSYATFLGASGGDLGLAVAVHPVGAIVIGGSTTSTDFPLRNWFQPTYGGNQDAFVAVLDSTGARTMSGFAGGSNADWAASVAFRSDATILVAGSTDSSDLPTSAAYSTSLSGTRDYAVAKISEVLAGSADAPSVTTTSFSTWTVGVAFEESLAAKDGTSPYTWSLASGAPAAGLSVTSGGKLTGTPTASGTFNFTVRAKDTYGISGSKALTHLVNPAPSITTSSLPDWTRTIEFERTLAATGGTVGAAGLTFTVSAGSLPPGLVLDTDGRLHGIPTTAGTSSFTVKVTDDVGAVATRPLTMSIRALPSVTAESLADWTAGEPWTHTFAATGGSGALAWSVASGTLPAGVDVGAATGRVSGNSKPAGTYDFTLRVTDGAGATDDESFRLVLNPAPRVVTAALPIAAAGRAFDTTLLAADGTPPLSWSLDTGFLPLGTNLATATGRVFGTPTVAGSYPITFLVTDTAGAEARRAVVLECAEVVDLAKKKLVATSQIGVGQPLRTVRALELLRGTLLTVAVKGGSAAGGLAAIRLYDAAGDEVDVSGVVRATTKGATLTRFAIPETGRWFLAVEAGEGFQGKLTTSVTIVPAARWTGTVAAAAGEEVELPFAVPPGARLSVTASPAKKSAAQPVVVRVLGPDDAELAGKLGAKGKSATFRGAAPLAGGEHRLVLSAKDGTAGDVVWTVTLKLPKTYDFEVVD